MQFGIENWLFTIVFIAAFALLTKNVIKLISYLKLAKGINRTDTIGSRILQTLKVAIFQTKIMRDPSGGTLHAWIFWGFLILLFAASGSVFTGFGIKHFWNFLGPIYSVITFLIDLFCVLIVIATIWAVLRRNIFKIKRLQVEGESLEANLILLTIFTIVVSLTLEHSAMYVLEQDASYAFRPISAAIATFISIDIAPTLLTISFWVHILLILAFMNYLPYSKHLHVLTSVPNVFLSNIGPVNKLEKIDFEQEGVEKFGVVDIEDLDWKSLLDGYTCTHCGRCTSVCPANITGKHLDPREVIMQIRERTFEKAPIVYNLLNNKSEPTEEEQKIIEKKFVGEYEHIESLWQCTTCGACMQECPVMIEHVPAIIGMRRSLVMMESNFPAELQPMFTNLENNGSPWAFSPMDRANWAEGLEVSQAAEKTEFDVLFWVGCAGSFDDRAMKVSIAFAKILKAANIDFAILGTEEQCNGDIARRAGNEYLADMLIKMNVDTLSRYKFNKIVATCPHCFNTIKNEYPDFGANYNVIHHTEYIQQLLDSGQLKLKEGANSSGIAYHDSCYLGRYNEIYDAPRNVLNKINGVKLAEVSRSKDKGLCCGAGGAQMFMEETVGKRVNVERTEELIATGCNTFAANCPFCITMLTDGLKAKDIENIEVKDIAEIIAEKI